jgi:D-glycero-D-manno-heptose 1,7-bisphosphate phosphatase
MKPAVFLDRDGVINKAFIVNGVPTPARSIEALQIIAKVEEALNELRKMGFEIVVVTNQPDVTRGVLSKESVESIHQRIKLELGIQHFYTCFHDDFNDCSCRKPKPGLLYLAAADLGLDLNRSFMVGDRWRDISAGQSAGCRCFFINYNYSEVQPKMPYLEVSSLFDAVQIILEEFRDTTVGQFQS